MVHRSDTVASRHTRASVSHDVNFESTRVYHRASRPAHRQSSEAIAPGDVLKLFQSDLSDLTDETLMRRVQRGNERALEALYDRYSLRLVNYFHRRAIIKRCGKRERATLPFP